MRDRTKIPDDFQPSTYEGTDEYGTFIGMTVPDNSGRGFSSPKSDDPTEAKRLYEGLRRSVWFVLCANDEREGRLTEAEYREKYPGIEPYIQDWPAYKRGLESEPHFDSGSCQCSICQAYRDLQGDKS